MIFHAAAIEKTANIPYIASAVWPAEANFFNSPKVKKPSAIRRESIHQDKIKIYNMVARTIKEPLPDLTSAKDEVKTGQKKEGSWSQSASESSPQVRHDMKKTVLQSLGWLKC